MLTDSITSATSTPYSSTGTTIQLLAARGIHPAKEQPRHPKDAYLFLCPLPGHANDTDLSFRVHADENQWKCFVCAMGGGPGELRRILDGTTSYVPTQRPASTLKTAPRKERPAGCTLRELAESKGLPMEHLRSLGWQDGLWFGIPAVLIPYPHGLRYRVSLEGKDRFRCEKGSRPGFYGIDRLDRTQGFLILVVGETDTASGIHLGFPTVGVPGVNSWKREWARDIEGLQLYIWQEPDKGGDTLVSKVAGDVPDAKVLTPPPGVKDLCELLSQAGGGAADMLWDLMTEATTVEVTVTDGDTPVSERVSHNANGSPELSADFISSRRNQLVRLLKESGRSEEAEEARVCRLYKLEECHNCLEQQAKRRYSCNHRGCVRDLSGDLARFFDKKRAGLPSLNDPVVLEVRTGEHPLECSVNAIKDSLRELRDGVNAYKRAHGLNSMYSMGMPSLGKDLAFRNVAILTEYHEGMEQEFQEWFARRLGMPVKVTLHDFADDSVGDRLALCEGRFKTLVIQSITEWADVEAYDDWQYAVKGLHTVQALDSLFGIKDSWEECQEPIERGADKAEHLKVQHGIEKDKCFPCGACGDKSGLYQTGELVRPDQTELIFSNSTRQYYGRVIAPESERVPKPASSKQRWTR